MKFLKLHGIGNSFVVMMHNEFTDYARQSDLGLSGDREQNESLMCQRLCNLNFGVGSEGMMLIDPTEEGFRVKMLNPDGSDGGMCGNGNRTVVRALHLWGLSTKSDITLIGGDGRKLICHTTDEGRNVRINMGKVSFTDADVNYQATNLGGYHKAQGKADVANAKLIPLPISYPIESVNALIAAMPNPHCLVLNYLDNPNNQDISPAELGPILEKHPYFTKRTNVEFVRITDKREIELTVWERGAGLTLACGTGACATVGLLAREGLMPYEEEITVKLPGGDLRITAHRNLEMIMEGPVTDVAEGRLFVAKNS